MHHSAQKSSKIISDLRRARCALRILFFCTPIFQIKNTPLNITCISAVSSAPLASSRVCKGPQTTTSG